MHEPPLLLMFFTSQACGLIAVSFIIMAAMEDRDNTPVLPGTDSAKSLFVWHFVLSSIGMIYLVGCSAIIYRVLTFIPKFAANVVHAGILLVALLLALIGIVLAVQKGNAEKEYVHFRTIHSIFGLVTILLFAIQWVVSIPVFYRPKSPDCIRTSGLAVHICLGIGVFTLATVTTFTGLTSHKGVTLTSEAYYKTAAYFYLFYTLTILFVVIHKQ